MTSGWDFLSSRWDTSGAEWNKPVAEHIIRLAGLKPGMVTADMGCGAGAVTLAAARVVSPAAVTGVDSSAGMIERARKEAAEHGIGNVGFVCEDVTGPLRLEPGTFDAVLASMVLSYLESPATALRAWRGLLRPAGVMVVTWVLAEQPRWQAVYDTVDSFLDPPDRWSAMRKPWVTQTVQALFPPGMDVKTTVEPLVTRYQSPEQWWRSSMSQAPALAWRHIPPGLQASACEAAFEILKKFQAPDGSLERTRAVGYTLARLKASPQPGTGR